MSKSAKTLGKLNLIESALKSYSQSSEGALDPLYYVKIQIKDEKKTWREARIVDCRLIKNWDSKQKKNDFSYEYYVHYENFDRRWDEWVQRSRIELTRRLVAEEIPLKKRLKKEENKFEYDNDDEHYGMNAEGVAIHEKATRFKTIHMIEMGRYRCEAWYYSPYPQGYQNLDCLYICEFCLSFFVTKDELIRHAQRCDLMHPPGDEIYRHERNSVFEIDGCKNTTFCENLSYLGKLFLDHKVIDYDTEPFLYYVLTENDEFGFHIVGYFSKDKLSKENYNLSCIMTLPFYQRKGYGKFLITFSYELSRIENKPGHPEKPLSDLGRESYKSWWTQRLIDYFRERKDELYSIDDIVKATFMRPEDVTYTLEKLNLIKYNQGEYIICSDPKVLDKIYKESGRPGLPVYSEKLHWVPFKYNYSTENQK